MSNVHQRSNRQCWPSHTFIKTNRSRLSRNTDPIPNLHNCNDQITQLKNYIYQWMTQEQLFIIPDNIRDRSNRKRLILVLDMDETLVYTRRDAAPGHSNYVTTDVDYILFS